MKVNDQNTKVVLIGIDAADWEMIDILRKKGRLPNLMKLMEEGYYSLLNTISPTLSAIIWTTIATGKTKEKHNIRGFVKEIEGKQFLYTSNMWTSKAIWDILSERGKTVGVIRWLITWPATKVNGFMITPYRKPPGSNLPKSKLYPNIPDQTYPRELIEEISPFILKYDKEADECFRKMIFPDVDIDRITDLQRTLIEQTRWTYVRDYTISNIGIDLLNKYKPDLFSIYLSGIDKAGHRFWKYMKHTRSFYKDVENAEMFENVIFNYYDFIDGQIGKIIKNSSPDTLFLIVSDHGMHSGKVMKGKISAEVSGHHKNCPGIFIANGNGLKNKSFIKKLIHGSNLRSSIKNNFFKNSISVYDITPTILYAFGFPIGKDMDGKVIENIFSHEVLRRSPVKYLDTYEAGIRDEMEEPIESPIDEEIKERLRNLGYID